MGRYTRTMAESLSMVREVTNMDLMRKAADGAMQTMKMKDGKVKMDSFTASAIMQIYDKVNPKNKKTMENMLSTGKIADLMKLQKFAMSKTSGGTFRGNQGIRAEYVPEELQEEVDLDEGSVEFLDHDASDKDFVAMAKKHKLKVKSDGEDTVATGDPKNIEKLLQTMYGNDWKDMYSVKGGKYTEEEVDLDEKVDPADIDTDATDDDIKSADKNIMMQMRKSQSLRGRYAVEFLDGVKVKVDPKIAMAVQQKYMNMRRPAEKEMFQSKVAQSYKSLLAALKEGFASDAQRKAAFASGYKEKGKKKKEEVEEAKQVLAHGGKGKYKVVSDGGAIDVMFGGKSVGKGDFDRGADSFFMSIKGEKGQKSFEDAQAIADYFAKNKITEGTWHKAKDMSGLKKLMKKPILLGKDGDGATAAIAPYIGDDELYDDLFDAGKKDGPKADARPLIKNAMQRLGIKEEVELDEAKYDLYHKDFSTAMQHAYKMAKKLHGITVDPKEIDDKVASGPKKPSEGKTNSYRLEGDKGAIQVQVYNKGGSKPFELNFYKEEVERKSTLQRISQKIQERKNG